MMFNMIRGSRAAFGTLTGHWWRGLTTGNRCLCLKPQEVPPAPIPAPVQAQDHKFKLPGYRPTPWDRRFLIWTGRFKTQEEIPEFVSYEMLCTAKDKMRVKVCYVMIAVTLLCCYVIISNGKRERKKKEAQMLEDSKMMALLRAEIEK